MTCSLPLTFWRRTGWQSARRLRTRVPLGRRLDALRDARGSAPNLIDLDPNTKWWYKSGMAGLSKPHQVITDHIISRLEQNEIPWRKPWSGDAFPRSLQTGNPYRGLNVFMLTCDATIRGYSSPWWVTFKQAKAKGGSIKKGAASTPLVFRNLRKFEDRDESTGETRTKES